MNTWAKVATLALGTVLVGAACSATTSSAQPASTPGAGASQSAGGGNEIDTLTWAGKNSIGSLDPALSPPLGRQPRDAGRRDLFPPSGEQTGTRLAVGWACRGRRKRHEDGRQPGADQAQSSRSTFPF